MKGLVSTGAAAFRPGSVARPVAAGFLLLALAPGSAIDGEPFPQAAPDRSLKAAVDGSRWGEAVRIFSTIRKPAPEDLYLAGVAHLRLHQPERAREELRRGKELGFSGWDGWPGAEALLRRIATVEEVLPPIRPGEELSADTAITVHAGPTTPWSGPILRAIPEFADVGRRIFGADLPRVRLVLFAERQPYERFHEAMFGVPVPTAWHDGTGNINIVVFCEKDRQGKQSRRAGEPETIGNVLHEFGHAWLASYLMDRHGREWLDPALRRPWLDEGLADYAASLREPAYLERRKAWVEREKVAKAVAPPTYQALNGYREFYEEGDVDTHYWLSALLVAELLGDAKGGPALIPRILDRLARSGDHEATVRSITGKDPRTELERLTRRLWESPR